MNAGGVQQYYGGAGSNKIKNGIGLKMGYRRVLGLSKPTGSVQMGRWVMGCVGTG